MLTAGSAALLTPGLAGCGSASSAATSASSTTSTSPGLAAQAATSATLDGLAVDLTAGQDPQLSLDPPVTFTATGRRVITTGSGPAVAAGQSVQVRYLGINARTGKTFDSTFGDPSPARITLSDPALVPGLRSQLLGLTVGSTALIGVAPADGYGGHAVPATDIEPGDSLLFLVSVLGSGDVLTRAQGVPVTPPPGLPVVSVNRDGVPSVRLPKAAPPKELLVQPLVLGQGAVVRPGQTVTVQYLGLVWPGGRVFANTWTGRGPRQVQVGVGKVVPAWDQGLVGQTVGSQVLLVAPPAEGFGPAGDAASGVGGSDTVVFVVDVLGVS